ncbi:hypothetical protein, partial [Vibrio azureus]
MSLSTISTNGAQQTLSKDREVLSDKLPSSVSVESSSLSHSGTTTTTPIRLSVPSVAERDSTFEATDTLGAEHKDPDLEKKVILGEKKGLYKCLHKIAGNKKETSNRFNNTSKSGMHLCVCTIGALGGIGLAVAFPIGLVGVVGLATYLNALSGVMYGGHNFVVDDKKKEPKTEEIPQETEPKKSLLDVPPVLLDYKPDSESDKKEDPTDVITDSQYKEASNKFIQFGPLNIHAPIDDQPDLGGVVEFHPKKNHQCDNKVTQDSETQTDSSDKPDSDGSQAKNNIFITNINTVNSDIKFNGAINPENDGTDNILSGHKTFKVEYNDGTKLNLIINPKLVPSGSLGWVKIGGTWQPAKQPDYVQTTEG